MKTAAKSVCPVPTGRLIKLDRLLELWYKQVMFRRPLYRVVLAALIFCLYVFAVVAVHLYLAKESYFAHGGEALLWNGVEALCDVRTIVAVAQYIAIFLAFAFAYIMKKCAYKWVALLLCVWGITWVPVALACSGDSPFATEGPFNFPVAMYIIPFFGVILLAEAGLILLARVLYKRMHH